MVEVVTQSAIGAEFFVQFQPPGPADVLTIVHLSIEIPNYSVGAVEAVVTIEPAGLFVCGTSQGQRDAAEGPLDVYGSELLRVTWNPTRVPGIVQGRAVLFAEQHDRRVTR